MQSFVSNLDFASVLLCLCVFAVWTLCLLQFNSVAQFERRSWAKFASLNNLEENISTFLDSIFLSLSKSQTFIIKWPIGHRRRTPAGSTVSALNAGRLFFKRKQKVKNLKRSGEVRSENSELWDFWYELVISSLILTRCEFWNLKFEKIKEKIYVKFMLQNGKFHFIFLHVCKSSDFRHFL